MWKFEDLKMKALLAVMAAIICFSCCQGKKSFNGGVYVSAKAGRIDVLRYKISDNIQGTLMSQDTFIFQAGQRFIRKHKGDTAITGKWQEGKQKLFVYLPAGDSIYTQTFSIDGDRLLIIKNMGLCGETTGRKRPYLFVYKKIR